MEQKCFVVLLVVAVLPVALTASAINRLGSVYLESRSKRASSTSGENSDFRGKYVSLQGDGIHFHSKNGYLSVTTLDDQPVFFASMDPLAEADGFGYVSIRGKPFAFVNDRAYALSEHIMSAQTLLSHGQREQLIAQLQEDYDGTVTKMSLDGLAQTREAILMEETAIVMGIEHGIIGSENPDVLPLYAMAMQLSRMRKETTATANILCDNYNCPRGGCNVDSFSGDKYCKSASQGDCPPCKPNACYGMCGKGCCCWSIICKDCCSHGLCEDHDICCRKYKWWEFWKNYNCYNVAKMIYRRVKGGCEGHYKC